MLSSKFDSFWKTQLLLGMVLMLGIFSPIVKAAVAPKVEVLKSFSTQEGSPYGKLVQDADGNLYGMLFDFTKFTLGALYKIDKSGNYSVLDSSYINVFNSILGADGKFYGTTDTGGKSNKGVVYQLDLTGATPISSVIHEFDSSHTNLTQGSDGNIYGLTSNDSTSTGTRFQLETSGAMPVYTVLNEFTGSLGVDSSTSVIFGSDGKLYKFFSEQYDAGIDGNHRNLVRTFIYQIDISGLTSVSTLIYTINVDKDQYINSLIQGSDGKLYGTFQSSEKGPTGKLFQLDISGATPVYTVLHEFPLHAEGRELIQGIDGKFYGTANNGCYPGNCVEEVFQLDLTSTTPSYSVLIENTRSLEEIYNQHLNGIGGLNKGADGTIYTYSGNDIYRIRIAPVNTPPVAANDSFALSIPKKNTPITIAAPGVLGNDKDAEGKVLAVVGATASSPKIIEFPQGGGKVALYADGHFVYTPGKKCFYGTRSFTYQVTDGQDDSNPATVTLTTKRPKQEHGKHEGRKHKD